MENCAPVRARDWASDDTARTWGDIFDAVRRFPRTLGRTLISMGAPLRAMLIVGTLIGLTQAAPADSEESPCARMLSGAPEHIRLLEAVQSCRAVDAGCGYFEPTPGFGVLTLLCPDALQVIFADRLSSLRLRDGTLAGECSTGSWQRDAGLPGCYPGSGSWAP